MKEKRYGDAMVDENKSEESVKKENRTDDEDGAKEVGKIADADKTTAEEKTADVHNRRIVYPDYEDTEAGCLREAEVAYGRKKRQGEYTIEDYYALPEDVRAELIDGVLYFKSSPTAVHQIIVGQLYVAFDSYIRKNHGDCEPFTAPLDVKLGEDEKTVVQPDFLVICDIDKIQDGIVQDAPDFIAEIISPSTGNYDRLYKLRKYRESGVREYWIIDPKKQQIEVYIFRNRDMDVLPRVYSFDDEVPVGIYDSDFKVVFSEIKQRIRRY